MAKNDVLPCSHIVNTAHLNTLKRLLKELPKHAPQLLTQQGIPTVAYDDLFRMAIESLRGSQSADPSAKRHFIKAVLDHLVAVGEAKSWNFIGNESRQDYKVELANGHVVAVEAKGCGDGNNLGIWDRPDWADQFVIWSLCPESLQHHPSHGVWSAISTRLAPKIIHEDQQVDAFVFYDQRCGSDLRPCPKQYGVQGLAQQSSATRISRSLATGGIDGQMKSVNPNGGSGVDWLPPPSIFLFPQTPPHPINAPFPPSHTISTCPFAKALLSAFGVPPVMMDDLSNTVTIEVDARNNGLYRNVKIYRGTSSLPIYESKWKKIRR